jgi:hypothetical protein
MDVNAVCREFNIQIPQVSIEPESLAAPLQQNIDLLEDVRWLLSELLNFLQLSLEIRELLQPTSGGIGLSERAQTMWRQATGNLSRETSVPEADLPIEEIARRVLAPISAARVAGRSYPGQDNDVQILTQIVSRMTSYLTGFRQALIADDHPFTGGSTYDVTSSFRANIRPILENIESQLTTAGITVDLSLINWEGLSASVPNIEAAIQTINNELIQPRCSLLAEALRPPVAPIISPPAWGPPLPPPPVVGPNVPGEPTPTPTPSTTAHHPVELALVLAPFYAVNALDARRNGPALMGRVGGGLNLREGQLRLQVDWIGREFIESFDDFRPNRSQDDFSAMVTWRNNQFQLGFTWIRDYAANEDDDSNVYLGTLGYARRFLGGFVIPFAQAMVGGDSEARIRWGAMVGLQGSRTPLSGAGVVADWEVASGFDCIEADCRGFQAQAAGGVYYRLGHSFFWQSRMEFGVALQIEYDLRSEGLDVSGQAVARFVGEDFTRPLPSSGGH